MNLNPSINFNSLAHYRTIERKWETYTKEADLEAMLGVNEADTANGLIPARMAS